MNGKDLQLRRVAMDVASGALAERIGVTVSTISRWEQSRRVTAKAVDRYLGALATFGTIPTISIQPGEAVA